MIKRKKEKKNQLCDRGMKVWIKFNGIYSFHPCHWISVNRSLIPHTCNFYFSNDTGRRGRAPRSPGYGLAEQQPKKADLHPGSTDPFPSVVDTAGHADTQR